MNPWLEHRVTLKEPASAFEQLESRLSLTWLSGDPEFRDDIENTLDLPSFDLVSRGLKDVFHWTDFLDDFAPSRRRALKHFPLSLLRTCTFRDSLGRDLIFSTQVNRFIVLR